MISPYVFPGLIDLKKESRNIMIERGLKYANTVIRSICFDRNITKTDIASTSRLKEICEARQISIYFIRKNTKLPLKEIGKLFNRDHATVIHSIESIENQLSYNKKMVLEINRLKLLF